ncbi:MAG: hypothetical protein DRJ31_06290 [Candidatus Methanomethylicota archaeon]|uniref:Cysteine-rich domain-containing protein n=1 Tax=Thermoproteota archaeon TaxID=2056631 RepID=A0A497ENB0_9CREN|nr:MAG: hypothetical protein DRJ31_06290 [Candidatus Verstraetearchaeota archaeon]
MRVLLYPGCMAALRYPHIEVSTKEILGKLGHQVFQLDHIICCGSCILESVNRMQWLSFASYILAQAEALRCDLIVTTCGTCTSTISKVREALLEDSEDLNQINAKLSKLNLKLSKPPNVHHITELLHQELHRLSRSRQNKGTAFIQNACNLTMTGRLPLSALAELVEAAGYEVIKHECSNICCGGSNIVTRREVFDMLAEKHYKCFDGQNPDIIVVSCSTSYMAFVEMGFADKVKFVSELFS